MNLLYLARKAIQLISIPVFFLPLAASSARAIDYPCYMVTVSGRILNLTSMCSSSATVKKAAPKFVSEAEDFSVTDLKLKRSPSGAFVEVSGKIKNNGKLPAYVNSVTLQIADGDTILDQTEAIVSAELTPGKSFVFRDLVSRTILEGKSLSHVQLTPISFQYKYAQE